MDRESNITQWADGLLSGEALTRFEAAMAEDPELRAEAEGARAIHEILQSGLPSETPVPRGTDFNAGVFDAIEAEKITPLPAPAVAAPSRLPWAIAAAACVAAAAAFWSPRHLDEPATPDRVAYTPDPAIDARVYVDEEAGATVILLEGIANIPDQQEIVPKTMVSQQVPGGWGSRAFYSENDSQLAMVLTRSASGNVRIEHVQ